MRDSKQKYEILAKAFDNIPISQPDSLSVGRNEITQREREPERMEIEIL